MKTQSGVEVSKKFGSTFAKVFGTKERDLDQGSIVETLENTSAECSMDEELMAKPTWKT